MRGYVEAADERRSQAKIRQILRAGEIRIGSPAFNSFPGAQWSTYLWGSLYA
jgi:hypothetical protein